MTEHNQRHLVTGRLDVPLNDLGRRQAMAAVPLVAPLQLAVILTSPLTRAYDTAQILAQRLNVAIAVVEDLAERDWGAMSGRTHRELMRDGAPPDAETAENFRHRVLGAVAPLTAPGPVLFVSHSGVCRVLRRHLGAAEVEAPVPNALPLKFAPMPEGWRELPVLEETGLARASRSSGA